MTCEFITALQDLQRLRAQVSFHSKSFPAVRLVLYGWSVSGEGFSQQDISPEAEGIRLWTYLLSKCAYRQEVGSSQKIQKKKKSMMRLQQWKAAGLNFLRLLPSAKKIRG